MFGKLKKKKKNVWKIKWKLWTVQILRKLLTGCWAILCVLVCTEVVFLFNVIFIKTNKQTKITTITTTKERTNKTKQILQTTFETI